jgi:hypothetical protein
MDVSESAASATPSSDDRTEGQGAAEPFKVMRLRYAGRCGSCGESVEAGARARYDKVSKTVSCLPCGERADALSAPLPSAGQAGASALVEHAKRKARYEQRVRQAHPILGGLKLFLNDDPQHIKAWTTGATGELIMGRKLNALAEHGVAVLHDRRVPGSTANIDHIAIGPSGVYVIDAKNYTGRVEVASKTRFGDKQLWVGKRDCSKLADAMVKQVHVVLKALEGLPEADGVPVLPVLAFVKADWPLFGAPSSFRMVRIEGENSTCRLVKQSGPVTPEQVHLIAHRLAARLKPSAG